MYQEYCLADADYVSRIPAEVPATLAAPLLCGGLTMYGALSRAELRAGDVVVIPGAGGGLGHLGVQIATSMGLQVIAMTRRTRKTSVGIPGPATFSIFAEAVPLSSTMCALPREALGRTPSSASPVRRRPTTAL